MAAKRKAAAARKRPAARRAGASDKQAEAGVAARAGVPEANVPPTTQAGVFSATGQAVRHALGQDERRKGKDRGAPEPKDAVKPAADAPKPQGLQKEPAIFTSNGEVPLNMQASPTG